MYQVLKHTHSGLRWLVLLFLIWSIVSAYKVWKSERDISRVPKVWLLGLALIHLQLLLGIVLYFISPYVQFNEYTMSDSFIRFYTVEHVFGMLLSVILITVGYSIAKKRLGTSRAGKAIFWSYLISLILILTSIPWPFRNLGGSWF